MKKISDSAGVTLIELLTVVAIVAILASVATASYRSYMLRANRTEAKTALLNVQVAQEKFFLQNRRYAQDNTELAATPPTGLGVPTNTSSGYYTIDLAGTATTYTATATAAGTQTGDKSGCLKLSIDDQGTRFPDASTGCWK
jgi:type IV pilus assembly protein PilE